MEVVVLFCVILGTLASSPEGKFCRGYSSFFSSLFRCVTLMVSDLPHVFPRDFIALLPFCFSDRLFSSWPSAQCCMAGSRLTFWSRTVKTATEANISRAPQ